MMYDNGVKWLPAWRLVELLTELPPDSRVMVNAVGNLLVRSHDDEKSLAFIDFVLVGSIEPMI